MRLASSHCCFYRHTSVLTKRGTARTSLDTLNPSGFEMKLAFLIILGSSALLHRIYSISISLNVLVLTAQGGNYRQKADKMHEPIRGNQGLISVGITYQVCVTPLMSLP